MERIWKQIKMPLVVVLRFSPANPVTVTTSQAGCPHATFGRKPPSQIRRDRKRAEERQKNKERPGKSFKSSSLFSTFLYADATRKLKNIPLTPTSVKQVHVKPGKGKQIVFYTCFSLTPTMTLSSIPQHYHQLLIFETSRKTTRDWTRKQRSKFLLRDTVS